MSSLLKAENSSSGKKFRDAASMEPDGLSAPERVNFSVNKNYAVSLLSICGFLVNLG